MCVNRARTGLWECGRVIGRTTSTPGQSPYQCAPASRKVSFDSRFQGCGCVTFVPQVHYGVIAEMPVDRTSVPTLRQGGLAVRRWDTVTLVPRRRPSLMVVSSAVSRWGACTKFVFSHQSDTGKLFEVLRVPGLQVGQAVGFHGGDQIGVVDPLPFQRPSSP